MSESRLQSKQGQSKPNRDSIRDPAHITCTLLIHNTFTNYENYVLCPTKSVQDIGVRKNCYPVTLDVSSIQEISVVESPYEF